MKIEKIAIIGNGALGGLLKRYFDAHTEVLMFDKGDDLASVQDASAIIFAIPIGAYESVFEEVKPYVSSETLLVDVCSVKLRSQELFDAHFAGHDHMLISHPMFGPESAKHTMEGRQLVVCRESGAASAFVDWFADSFGPTVIRMTADEHDKTMADMHALTFFVARGLSRYGVESKQLEAGSYDWMLGLRELDSHHSDELIDTIERYNPYAKEARARFLARLTDLDSEFSAD